MKKKIVFGVLILFVCLGVYNYIYQDHRNINTEKPKFTLTSQSITYQFSNNSTEAEQKFLNESIEILGKISEINLDNIVLDNSIFCQFQKSIANTYKANELITIKGRCIGYDNLLEEIKLDQCIIINNQK